VCHKGRTIFVSILQLGVQRVASIEESPNVPKKLVMGQSIWLLQAKKKKSKKV
jgi:hypothetical protein